MSGKYKAPNGETVRNNVTGLRFQPSGEEGEKPQRSTAAMIRTVATATAIPASHLRRRQRTSLRRARPSTVMRGFL